MNTTNNPDPFGGGPENWTLAEWPPSDPKELAALDKLVDGQQRAWKRRQLKAAVGRGIDFAMVYVVGPLVIAASVVMFAVGLAW